MNHPLEHHPNDADSTYQHQNWDHSIPMDVGFIQKPNQSIQCISKTRTAASSTEYRNVPPKQHHLTVQYPQVSVMNTSSTSFDSSNASYSNHSDLSNGSIMADHPQYGHYDHSMIYPYSSYPPYPYTLPPSDVSSYSQYYPPQYVDYWPNQYDSYYPDYHVGHDYSPGSDYSSSPSVRPSMESYHKEPTSRPPVTIIPDVAPADVLSGRGGGTASHPGNRQFRALVKHHQDPYIHAKKCDKVSVAKHIVQIIRERGGRFLSRFEPPPNTSDCKKKSSSSSSSSSSFYNPNSSDPVLYSEDRIVWYDIGDSKAIEKTCQALREGAPERRRLHRRTIKQQLQQRNHNNINTEHI
jgi:hypothetical protein